MPSAQGDAELEEAKQVKAAMTFQRRKAQRQQPSHHQVAFQPEC
jgi:hypothetical protein